MTGILLCMPAALFLYFFRAATKKASIVCASFHFSKIRFSFFRLLHEPLMA